MKTEQTNWQRRRSDFNHQWLKNRYLSALDAAEQVIRGRVKAAAYWQEFIEVDLREWQERRDDLRKLLEDFEKEMSPRRFFDSPPLADCDSPAEVVLADLVHQLWLVRYPVGDWIGNARTSSLKVDNHFKLLLKIEPVDETGKVRAEFVAEFEKFRAACRDLSRAVEKFPDRILVT